MERLVDVRLLERVVLEVDPLWPVWINELVKLLDSERRRSIIQEWDKTSRVDESKNPERKESDIMFDSRLQFEDGRIGEQVSKFLGDVRRVVENDDVSGRTSKDENRSSGLASIRTLGKNELSVTLGVEREEVVFVNRCIEFF